MKYYTLISSLNVDNVLSSESISPISMYKNRHFGYKSFEKINNLFFPENQIIFFDYIPFFEIIDNEKENYPIVLEIEDDDQLNSSTLQKTDEYYSIDKTVYINPLNCSLIYFSKEAFISLDIKCSDSRNNKLYHFFQKKYVDTSKAIKISDIDYKIDDITNSKSPDEECINIEKGFFYGWYIGSGKCIDPIIAKLKAIEMDIRDYISAIKNNAGKGISYQEKIKALDEEFKSSDPNVKKAAELWNNSISTFCNDKRGFDEWLKNLDIEKETKEAFLKKENIHLRKDISFNQYDLYLEELSNYIHFLSQKNPIKFELYQRTDDFDGELYERLKFAIFMDKRIDLEHLRLNRLEVATLFIREIKSYFEEQNRQWPESKESSYFKSLCLNIVQADPFDFSSIENKLYKSIAAFLLKGNDLNDLIVYLQKNAVSDYRYVLGFWGAACGYADMPRSFTKPLFESKDYETISSIYKKIHNQLFGCNLNGHFENQSHQGNDTPKKKAIVENIHIDSTFPECLKALFASNEFKELKDEQKYYKEESLNCWSGKLDNDFISSLTSIQPKGRTKKKWNKCVKLLENRLKNDANIQPIDFNKSTGPYFYNDPNIWNHIEPLISTEEKKEVGNQIKWIKSVYKDGGYKKRSGEWVPCNDKSNESVIKHFYNNNKNNKSINSTTLEKIIKKLKEIYKVN